MNKLVEIFCDVDDFCRVFIPELEKQLIADGSQKHKPSSRMLINAIRLLYQFHLQIL